MAPVDHREPPTRLRLGGVAGTVALPIAALLTAVAGTARAESALAPLRAILPPERPVTAAPPPEQKPKAASEAEVPPEKEAPPEQQTAPSAGTETVPQPRAGQPAEPPAPPEPERLAESDLELGACLGRLGVYGTVFERGEPVSEQEGACGIVHPVRVTGIVPGVDLSPPGIMRCETAAALAEWVRTFVLPASRLLPDRGRLTGITQASTYVCRRRNNAETGPLSEHAFGNAVDISEFRFADGAPIRVEPREGDGTPDEAFQRAARATACLDFTTVLGPGEPGHDTHLHLDIEARKSGFRLCE